jgi:uncharacterized protein YkwD
MRKAAYQVVTHRRRASSWCLKLLSVIFLSGVRFAQERVEVEPKQEPLIQEVIRIANAERAERGVGTLHEQLALRDAAEWMAKDMATHGYFSHTDSQGRDMTRRFQAFGYDRPHLMAENIEKGTPSPEATVQGWLSSPEHRRNLLHPEVREVGVGYAVDPHDQPYWVLDLGARFDVKRGYHRGSVFC